MRRKAFETMWLKCSNCSPDSCPGEGGQLPAVDSLTAVPVEAAKETG